MAGTADVVVVGAGPAGLAAAATARSSGLEVEILEAADSVGTSWRHHYDRLHLHTTRRLSGLPGLPIPPRAGRWVSRDNFVAYLEEYARQMRLQIHFQTQVSHVEREGAGWRLKTSGGDVVAPRIVIATGYNHTKHIPACSGRDTFAGELTHSSDYRNPEPYRGRDVLVVGSGNSGAEIAADLAQGGARTVWISIRTPPNIVRRNLGPLANQQVAIAVHRLPVGFVDSVSLLMQRATIGDLSRFGLEMPKRGVYSRILEEEQIPLIDVGFLRELKAGRIEVVPALERFEGAYVICGGRRLKPDAVIAATGYSRGLDPLVGHLGVLGAGGRPNAHAPASDPRTPGLYFIGYQNPIVGNLYEVARTARRLAAAMTR